MKPTILSKKINSRDNNDFRKKVSYSASSVALVLIVILNFSFNLKETRQFGYSPVLMKRTDLEKSIFSMEARTLNSPGKIYTKDNYIFICEAFTGVHVIDNTNPASPINVGFINVPGIVDISIKAGIMYVDNAVDLVAIDLSNFPAIMEVNRVKNIFPELTPPGSQSIPDKYQPSKRPSNTVIVNWIKKSV